MRNQKSNKNEVFLGKAWSSYTNDEIFKSIKRALDNTPATFHLHILDVNKDISNEYYLMMFYLIKSRNAQTRFYLHLHSTIYNSAILLMLIADDLYIRPFASLYFEAPDIYQNIDEECQEDSSIKGPIPSDDTYNHLNVILIVSEYLPIKQFYGRRVSLDEVSEYLIKDSDLDFTTDVISSNL